MPEGPSLLIALFVVGFLLIAAEVFLPGLILGTIGFLCLVASVVVVYVQYGTAAGLIATFVVGGLSLVGFVVWLFVFPHTFIGRRLMLRTRQPADHTAAEHRTLVGESGEALTPLRPSGTARIGGKRVDVTAVGDFLESGAAIVVIAADGMRVVVRRKDGLVPVPEAV
ncbi:MAG: NfeD family protein [Chthoniobacterales bacterium]